MSAEEWAELGVDSEGVLFGGGDGLHALATAGALSTPARSLVQTRIEWIRQQPLATPSPALRPGSFSPLRELASIADGRFLLSPFGSPPPFSEVRPTARFVRPCLSVLCHRCHHRPPLTQRPPRLLHPAMLRRSWLLSRCAYRAAACACRLAHFRAQAEEALLLARKPRTVPDEAGIEDAEMQARKKACPRAPLTLFLFCAGAAD